MNIFKSENKRKGYKLVGVSLPPRENNYLTLFVLAKSTSKSKILISLIKTWIESKYIKESFKDLTDQIADRINIRWKATTGIPFKDFQNMVEKELKEKGIDSTHITNVLLKMKE